MGAPLNPLVNGINTFGSQGKSSNNMMLVGLKHQFSHTFSAEGQFTWGHSEDTDSGPYSRSAYLYDTKYSFSRSDFDLNRTFKVFGVWQPVFFHDSHSWQEKVAGGWTLTGILTFHTGYGWTPTYTAPHQIYCNQCNYGYQSLRPIYLGGAGYNTNNLAFETGSNFFNQAQYLAAANTGANNDQFFDGYFEVPNYANAITDSPGQSATIFIPPPGIGKNSFPGPALQGCRHHHRQSLRFAKHAQSWATMRPSRSRPTCSTSLT